MRRRRQNSADYEDMVNERTSIRRKSHIKAERIGMGDGQNEAENIPVAKKLKLSNQNLNKYIKEAEIKKDSELDGIFKQVNDKDVDEDFMGEGISPQKKRP